MKRNDFGPEYRPIVRETISLNGISHQYAISRLDGPITNTPHVEARGIDLSRTFAYGRMDAETLLLYNSVRALHEGISGVSIGRHVLEVDGPEGRDQRGYYKGVWPERLDAYVIDCLALHLGWRGSPLVVVRQETEEEWWAGIRNRMAIANSGIDVDMGEWPYDV